MTDTVDAKAIRFITYGIFSHILSSLITNVPSTSCTTSSQSNFPKNIYNTLNHNTPFVEVTDSIIDNTGLSTPEIKIKVESFNETLVLQIQVLT